MCPFNSQTGDTTMMMSESDQNSPTAAWLLGSVHYPLHDLLGRVQYPSHEVMGFVQYLQEGGGGFFCEGIGSPEKFSEGKISPALITPKLMDCFSHISCAGLNQLPGQCANVHTDWACA